MSKHRVSNSEAQRLADFTDRLLMEAGSEKASVQSEKQQADRLQETIWFLHRTLSYRQPDAALRKRVLARLAAEWTATGPGVRKGSKAWHSSRQVQRLLVVWSVAILVSLVVIGVFSAGWIPAGMAGAAKSNGGWLAVIVLIVLGIIGFILWRQNQRP